MYLVCGPRQFFFFQCGPELPKSWTPLQEHVLVKILLCGISEILPPIFSSRTFMVLWLMFKSFIHFEFILVYGVSWWSCFILFHACPVLPTPFIEEAIFTPFYVLPPLSNIDHKDTGLFLGSPVWSIDLYACSYASTRLFLITVVL